MRVPMGHPQLTRFDALVKEACVILLVYNLRRYSAFISIFTMLMR
jgi:hypothetical protein